jgi:hypothetical protein
MNAPPQTRDRRGTIPRPTEINSSLPPQPAIVPLEPASPDATGNCGTKTSNNPALKSARSCSSSVRYPG